MQRNPLALTAGLAVAMILYAGLSVLFYSPEAGFSWAGYFLLATVLFLVIFFLMLRRSLRKLEKESKLETKRD